MSTVPIACIKLYTCTHANTGVLVYKVLISIEYVFQRYLRNLAQLSKDVKTIHMPNCFYQFGFIS